MAKTFQQEIDEALKSVPAQGKWGNGMVMSIPTNEKEDQAEILHRLSERGRIAATSRLHIGVAGFFNFEVAAITRPSALLLLDINESQTLFWRSVVTLLKEHATPEGFREAFLQCCESPASASSRPFTSFHMGDDYIPSRYGRESHQYYFDTRLPNWLKEPAAYHHLRQLALDGKIASATINLITDEQRAIALHRVASAQGFTTDTCYWSNIGGVLLRENRAPDFKKMLGIVEKIGGQTGMHMFTRNGSEGELLITDGPPRNLAWIAARQVDQQIKR